MCLSCWDKKRGRKPERKASFKKSHDKWYSRVKGTEEHKKYERERIKIWHGTSHQYRIWLKKEYLKRIFKRIILNNQNGTGRDLKRNKGGLQFRCEGCIKNCLITSPVKPDKLTGFKTEKAMREFKIFKEVLIKYCKDKCQ